jgi:hypothetical protein
MKIGFIKFGLKTYFNKDGNSNQGSNHELVDVFRIFEERDHECIMLSNNDIDENWLENQNQDFDYIFVFNGLTTNNFSSKMNMFQGSIESMKFLDSISGNIPWVYFWTDPRYDLEKNVLFKKFPPSLILSQEPEHYGHLDKLILYKKEVPKLINKDIKFGILMNETGEIVRRKALFDVINWLKTEKIPYEIKGKWSPIASPIAESEVQPYLNRVKYSFNVGKDKNWVSQKYWEMILSGVICFYNNYDDHALLLSTGSPLRVVDGIDVVNNVKKFEERDHLYSSGIILQESQIKTTYLDGSFIYGVIMEKLKEIK